MDKIYDIAQWVVHNIEDLSIGYMNSNSLMSFAGYIKARAATSLQYIYNSKEVDDAFDDDRIKVIISFFEESRDESKDSLH